MAKHYQAQFLEDFLGVVAIANAATYVSAQAFSVPEKQLPSIF